MSKYEETATSDYSLDPKLVHVKLNIKDIQLAKCTPILSHCRMPIP